MPIPSRRLLLLLAAAALLFLVSGAAAGVATAVLLGLAVLDGRRAGRGVVVDRSAPGQLSLAERGTVRIAVASGSGSARPVRVRVTDDLPPGLQRLDPDVVERTATGAAPAEVVYRVRAAERGVHALGAIHVRALGPWGLAWRQRRYPRRDDLLVLPGLLEMRRLRLLGLRERLRRAGLRNTRQRGEGRSFESLREYVRGDDPRTIDWKATAHRGGLMVRQYEAERSQNLVLALDAGRMMTERIGDRERLDHAMSAALLLADIAGLHGDRVGLCVFADEVLRFLPPRRLAMDRLAEAMARVPSRMVEPNYPLAFNLLRRRLGRRALIVTFTDIIDPAASSALIAQLARSAERHLVLAVTLRNPALTERAAAAVDDEAGAYRRAAAEEMLEARAVALGRMRRAGIHVADVEPSEAVSEVLNRYLAIKYRGQL